MQIGLLQVKLFLPGIQSLKSKRRIIKSIKDRVRNHNNISISEIDYQDVWQESLLGVVTIGTDQKRVSQVLASVIKQIESTPNSEITDRHIEML